MAAMKKSSVSGRFGKRAARDWGERDAAAPCRRWGAHFRQPRAQSPFVRTAQRQKTIAPARPLQTSTPATAAIRRVGNVGQTPHGPLVRSRHGSLRRAGFIPTCAMHFYESAILAGLGVAEGVKRIPTLRSGDKLNQQVLGVPPWPMRIILRIAGS